MFVLICGSLMFSPKDIIFLNNPATYLHSAVLLVFSNFVGNVFSSFEQGKKKCVLIQ